MANDHHAYFEYLNRRSRLGHAYRRHWLYPRLCRELRGRVLDVGCGIGDLLRFRPGTVGVDINPQTVAACQAAGLNATMMEPDRLPFADASFDGVVLDNVLEHLADPHPLLAEIGRVIRPAGRLLVGVPGRKGYAADPDHKVHYDAEGMRRTVEAAGFEHVLTFNMPLPSEWLDARMRQFCRYGVFERLDSIGAGH